MIIKTDHHVQYGAKKDEFHPAGTNLEVGKDITQELAKELLKKGAASDVTPESDKAPTPDPVTLEQFMEAVAKLETGNEQHWTNDGRPDCNALASVGCEVKAKERDAFWAEMKAAE